MARTLAALLLLSAQARSLVITSYYGPGIDRTLYLRGGAPDR